MKIITIFPESFDSFLSTSIIGNALGNGLFEVELYKLNDFSELKTKRVDKKAYGMHGQVISPEPLSRALESIFEKIGHVVPVIYMCPKGELLTQELVEKKYEEFREKEIIIICGHYEGIDERINELYKTIKISIGEYVLTSGELSAQVFIDSLVRHIPGALGNKESLEEDSFSKKFDRLKEYPVYTRPEDFMGKKVPEILLSGNHKQISNWKKSNLK